MTRSEAAKLRAKKYRERYGEDYFKKLGSIGGNKRDINKVVATNKERYGEDFYLKLAKMGREHNKNKRELKNENSINR